MIQYVKMGKFRKTPGNDANGITWIKLDCLVDMYKTQKIKLNYQCKFLLNIKFNIKI